MEEAEAEVEVGQVSVPSDGVPDVPGGILTTANARPGDQVVDALGSLVGLVGEPDRTKVTDEGPAQDPDGLVDEAQQDQTAEGSASELPAANSTSGPGQDNTGTSRRHVRFDVEGGSSGPELSAVSTDEQVTTSLQDDDNDSDDDTAPEAVTAKDKSAMPDIATTPRRPKRKQKSKDNKQQQPDLHSSESSAPASQALDLTNPATSQAQVIEKLSLPREETAAVLPENIPTSPFPAESLFTFDSSGDPDLLTSQQRRALLPSLPPKTTGSFARFQTGKTGHRKTQVHWAGRSSFLRDVKT